MTLGKSERAICSGANVLLCDDSVKIVAVDFERQGAPTTRIRVTEDGRLIENSCSALETGNGVCPFATISSNLANSIALNYSGGAEDSSVGFSLVDRTGREVKGAVRDVGGSLASIARGADCPLRPSPGKPSGITLNPDLRITDDERHAWLDGNELVQD